MNGYFELHRTATRGYVDGCTAFRRNDPRPRFASIDRPTIRALLHGNVGRSSDRNSSPCALARTRGSSNRTIHEVGMRRNVSSIGCAVARTRSQPRGVWTQGKHRHRPFPRVRIGCSRRAAASRSPHGIPRSRRLPPSGTQSRRGETWSNVGILGILTPDAVMLDRPLQK